MLPAVEHDRRGEVRLPAAVATTVAIVLFAALPDPLIVGPRYVLPVLEVPGPGA